MKETNTKSKAQPRTAGSLERVVRMPTINVAITGCMGIGKSCLGNKLALLLASEGHEVVMEDGGEEAKPYESIAQRFTAPRVIRIRIDVAREAS